MNMIIGLALLINTLFFQHVAAVTCFTPNGTSRNSMFNVSEGWIYAPCNNVAKFSMCCAIGPGRGSPDSCLDNGLCYNSYSNQFWRESCTDPTWQDPACIKLFLNGTGYNDTTPAVSSNGDIPTDVSLTPCDDGSYCTSTGLAGKLCCSTGQGYFISNGEQTKTNPNATSTSSATPSSTSAISTTSTVSSTTPTSSSTSGLSTGAKIGIGIGVGAGTLALLSILGFFCLTRRRRQKSKNPSEAIPPSGPAATHSDTKYNPLQHHPSDELGEMEGDIAARELMSHDRPEKSGVGYRAVNDEHSRLEMPA